MAVQYSVTVNNARLNAIENTIGTAPTLEIRTGAPPANCAAADSGSLLCSITLPSDWLAAAASGVKSKSGTWSGTATAGGTAGHWRIKQSTTCHIQGTITAQGGGGDMLLANTAIVNGQSVTITTATITAGNT